MSWFRKIVGSVAIAAGLSVIFPFASPWLLLAVGFLAVGGHRLLQPDLPGAPSVDRSAGITQARISESGPRQWIIGRARVAGQLVYHEEERNRRVLHRVFCLSEGPCTALEGVWINGERQEHYWGDPARLESGSYSRLPNQDTLRDDQKRVMQPASGSRYGPGTNWIIKFYPNGADSIPPFIRRTSGSNDWDASDMGRGKAFVAVELYQPDYGRKVEDRLWTRIPELSFLVKGFELPVVGLNPSGDLP